jgi:hypothetical protein
MTKVYTDAPDLNGFIRIAPSAGTVPLTAAGIFWELPLGMHRARNGALLRNNNKKNPEHPFTSGASV